MQFKPISILICLIVTCQCYHHQEVSINFTFNTRQIAQYKDTIRGCAGFQCFVYNFTAHQIQYSSENPTAGNRWCNFTDYLMIQRKFNKMWHFQICNMSNTSTTAVYSLLKFQDLSTGIKFAGNMSTFGYFENEDFPWYFSKSAKQMVMPWYYLKTLQKITFNVNGDKIMMQGFKTGKGYQIPKNTSSTTIFKLEGYPDDNSSHSILATNLPLSVTQACLVANGKYIVMILMDGPSIAIYNTSSKETVFHQTLRGWVADLIKLKKVNETHVVVANGGLSPGIRIYDARVPSAIVTIDLNTSTKDTILTPYLDNNTLVYHSTFDNNIHILTNLTIRKQIKIEYVATGQKDQPICQEPNQIINNKYCVLCGDQCNQCNPVSPSICITCHYGFVLRNGSCVVHSSLAMAMDVLAGLSICNMFNFDMGIWELVDDIWLYNYHTLRYEQYAKSTLKIINTLNINRYVPYSLNNFIPRLQSLQPNNSQYSAAPIKYINYIYTNRNEHNITFFNVFVVGVLLTALIFVLFYGVFKILLRIDPAFAIPFINSTVGFILLSQIMNGRIGYVGWIFWSEILDPSFNSLSEKLLMIPMVVVFFIMFVYVLAFYPLAQWHYKKKSRSLQILCSFCRNDSPKFRFLTINNCLLLLQSFLHIYLSSSNPALSKILLFSSALLKLINLMAHYRIYKTVLLYFTSLFYQVSLFLFAGIILLDELECPQLFQVKIKLVQFIALLMLAVFALLKVFFSAAIGLRRFIPHSILSIFDEKIKPKMKKQVNHPKIQRQAIQTSRKVEQKQNQESKYMKKDEVIEDKQGSPPSLVESFLYFMKKSQRAIGINKTPTFGRSNKVSPQTQG